MKRLFLGLAITALAVAVFQYQNNSSSSETSLLFNKKNNNQYALVGQGKKDNLVGTYYTTTAVGDKELILDSTYTYTYTVNKENHEWILEGSWELSYKDDNQHIILHRPFHATEQNAPVSNFEELHLTLTSEGLKNAALAEYFTKTSSPNHRLVFND